EPSKSADKRPEPATPRPAPTVSHSTSPSTDIIFARSSQFGLWRSERVKYRCARAEFRVLEHQYSQQLREYEHRWKWRNSWSRSRSGCFDSEHRGLERFVSRFDNWIEPVWNWPCPSICSGHSRSV